MKLSIDIKIKPILLFIILIGGLFGLIYWYNWYQIPENSSEKRARLSQQWDMCDELDKEGEAYWNCREVFNINEVSKEAYIQSKINNWSMPIFALVILILIWLATIWVIYEGIQ